ncbi:recombinase zinc beta ribbon domain-containing protein [Streptomyces acidicola]|uniref:recombinase zinc beta ribbon domain-containing protein n=1 Tax=Streptomyces acidicola TaxID=2596892 RepID=UPI0037B67B14
MPGRRRPRPQPTSGRAALSAEHGTSHPRQPRYTGRQVWNRQRTDHGLLDPANTTLGHRDVMRWNTPNDWIISTRPAHPALVSEADFIAVQHLRTHRETTPGRTCLVAGLLRCGVCGRRLESHWAHHRPGYRCRHGHTSPGDLPSPQPGGLPDLRPRDQDPDRRTHHRQKGSSSAAPKPTDSPTKRRRREKPGQRHRNDEHPPRPEAECGCRCPLPKNRAPWANAAPEGHPPIDDTVVAAQGKLDF